MQVCAKVSRWASVLTMLWLYLSAVFYPISSVPLEVQKVILSNPMYHYITLFRELVLYGTIPAANTWLICIGISFLMFAFGVMVFRKLQRNFILYI